mgnify:CR=1 FL=1
MSEGDPKTPEEKPKKKGKAPGWTVPEAKKVPGLTVEEAQELKKKGYGIDNYDPSTKTVDVLPDDEDE